MSINYKHSLITIRKQVPLKSILSLNCLWISLLLTCQNGHAQKFTYEEGRSEVFSEENILFVQDQQGFLWGTDKQGSLVRFDGFEYKYFPIEPHNSKGLIAPIRFLLLIDRNNQIWFNFRGNLLGRYTSEKALTSYSTNRYIRLPQARRLLTETDEPVGNIAFGTGFSDPGYFIRAIRKEFKQTSTEWPEG